MRRGSGGLVVLRAGASTCWRPGRARGDPEVRRRLGGSMAKGKGKPMEHADPGRLMSEAHDAIVRSRPDVAEERARSRAARATTSVGAARGFEDVSRTRTVRYTRPPRGSPAPWRSRSTA